MSAHTPEFIYVVTNINAVDTINGTRTSCVGGIYYTYEAAIEGIRQTIHDYGTSNWKDYIVVAHIPDTLTVGIPDFVFAFTNSGTPYKPDIKTS